MDGDNARLMSRKDAIHQVRDILIKRKRALTQLAATEDEAPESLSDVADQAVAEDIAHISKQTKGNFSNELTLIDEALVRISDGMYGTCESCDVPIPMARLQALPYASRCINCQREVEKNIRNVFDTKKPSFNFSNIAEDLNESDLPSSESVE